MTTEAGLAAVLPTISVARHSKRRWPRGRHSGFGFNAGTYPGLALPIGMKGGRRAARAGTGTVRTLTGGGDGTHA